MGSVLTLAAVEPKALAEAVEAARAALEAIGVRVKGPVALGPSAVDLACAEGEPDGLRDALAPALGSLAVDYAVQPAAGRRKSVLLADMDSTIVACECLDELADFAGVKAEVAAITERSMRGEIDFAEALRVRVALLKGLPLAALDRCFEERVRLIPGAWTAIATLGRAGVRCVLVSGGFRPFTTRAAALAGFHAERGNEFIHDGALLSGEVREPILGPEAKLAALREETSALGLTPADAICVGDGANDLPMVRSAGLGVAYRGKPVLRAQAHARIDHTDLRTLLYFQGYRSGEFARPRDPHEA